MNDNNIRSYELVYIKNPLVSILVPVFNHPNTIFHTLQSCLEQTYKNLEIICLASASNQKVLNILHQYEKQDSRIQVFESEKILSYQQVSQDLITKSNGQYFIFLSSTSTFYKNAIKKMVEMIEQLTEVIVVTERPLLKDFANWSKLKQLFSFNHANFDRIPKQFVLNEVFDWSAMLTSKNFYMSLNATLGPTGFFDFGLLFRMITNATHFRAGKFAVNKNQKIHPENMHQIFEEKIEFYLHLIKSTSIWLSQINTFNVDKHDFIKLRINMINNLFATIINWWLLFDDLTKKAIINKLKPLLDHLISTYKIDINTLQIANKRALIKFFS